MDPVTCVDCLSTGVVGGVMGFLVHALSCGDIGRELIERVWILDFDFNYLLNKIKH